MSKDCGWINTKKEVSTQKKEMGVKDLNIFANVFGKNEEQAKANRRFFDERRILAINLMSSPGAGKTALLESTVERLKGKFRIRAIEGDLATQRDAERLRAKGIPAYQITTGQTCHIDAFMVNKALQQMDLVGGEILFIENVGNLICPAYYALGTHLNVVLLSVVEGEDKPAKYPLIFRKADLLLITKMDLLAYVDFDVKRAMEEARRIQPALKIHTLSSLTGEGMEEWCEILMERKGKGA